ncbi:MAG: hypothetical protein WDW38_001668 [Sanguina aurantia]
MTLKVSAPDGVKVYNVTSGKTLPQWLSEGKKRSLRKDEDYRRRLELIQDFGFPAACQRIKASPDHNYIFATGYHPPQVRVYDLANLSVKFDRNLDAEIVDFQILTEDYSKAVFLCADRTLCFHARFGGYTKTRVPKFGRDLTYAPFLAELLIAGSSPEVYRMSLEEGRFMTPLTCRSPSVNACGISPTHGLFACAGDDGVLECFDLRQRKAAGYLDAAAAAGAAGQQLTALRFDDSGLHVAVGTQNGLVSLFDLRSQRPLVVKDHMYGSRIVDIKFHSGSGERGGMGGQRVISADTRIVKVWDASTGEGYTSIEPSAGGDINDICVWPGSGLIMMGCDAPRIEAYFIPSLGPAPRWASFLEGLTEELEERAPTLYDDYRFITRPELAKLGLDHLMGTSLLRAYMHGFFVDNRLYNKARAMMDPFAYETYRAQRIAKKVEDERAVRISIVKKLPKVNTKTAARLLAQDAAAAATAAVDGAAAAAAGEPAPAARRGPEPGAGASMLGDTRFGAMFEDADFTINEGSDEFKLLHPNAVKEKAAERRLLTEHFKEVLSDEDEDEPSDEEMEEDDGSEEDEGSEDSLEEMGEAPPKRVPARLNPKLRNGRGRGETGGRAALSVKDGGVKKPAHQVSMFAARDAGAADAYRRQESLAGLLSMPLSERVAGDSGKAFKHIGGSRELKFVARADREDGGGSGGRGGRGGRGRGGENGMSQRSDRGMVAGEEAGERGAVGVVRSRILVAGDRVEAAGVAPAVGAVPGEVPVAAVGVAGVPVDQGPYLRRLLPHEDEAEDCAVTSRRLHSQGPVCPAVSSRLSGGLNSAALRHRQQPSLQQGSAPAPAQRPNQSQLAQQLRQLAQPHADASAGVGSCDVDEEEDCDVWDDAVSRAPVHLPVKQRRSVHTRPNTCSTAFQPPPALLHKTLESVPGSEISRCAATGAGLAGHPSPFPGHPYLPDTMRRHPGVFTVQVRHHVLAFLV